MRKLLLFEDFNPDSGIFIDERDGNQYKTIRVNDTIWMAENFRYNYTLKAMDKHSGFWNMLDIKKTRGKEVVCSRIWSLLQLCSGSNG